MPKIFNIIMLLAIITLAGCSGQIEDKPDYTINDLFHDGEGDLRIYYVWGDGCPICARAAPYINSLEDRYDVELIKIEVYGSRQNQATFSALAQRYNVQASGVPTIFIGQESVTGYTTGTDERIDSLIENCLENPESCQDPLQR